MTEQTVIDLNFIDLALVYGLILLTAGLARLTRIGQERDLLQASLRMVVQLLLVGYILHAVFALREAWSVLLILAVMLGFSVQVIGQRVKNRMPRFYRVTALALSVGCGGATFFFCILVVAPDPWFDPRYLIPLAGMIIGNSMNGAALAAERMASEMQERRLEIETSLCLGASSRTAAREVVRSAYRAALIPVTNTMSAMGLVFLPGMMTGQILSGTEPVLAVKYQIAIMCAISGAVAVSAFLIVFLGFRGYFTQAHQLRRLDENAKP